MPVIWVIPLAAIAIGAWLAWDTLSKEGPTITVSFESAEGLQSGQSQLRFKDITLGTVKDLELSPDHTHVVVTIGTTKQAEPLLTDQTLFWVVKPRLFAGNLSGLSTLLTGAYIAMLPRSTSGRPRREFIGRENPPVLEANVPGHTFLLTADRLGSISLGSPVFFRDLNVGEVLGWDIADMVEIVTIHAFVRAPFDTYVHDQTRFWNASGLSVKLSSTGVEMQVESLRALLLGGIAFETPPAERPGGASSENHVFPLFENQTLANAASYSRKIPMLAYFPGSVSGLAPGSAVTMHGLVVGQVTGVRLVYDAAKDAVLAPIRFDVEPERVLGVGRRAFDTPAEGVDQLVKQGLRATLQSASIITGQQVVALDLVPNPPPATVTMAGEDFVIPTTDSGGLTSIETSVTQLLSKVNTIPFARIGKNLDGTLQAMNNITNSPELQQSLTNLSGAIKSVDSVVQHLDSDMTPALRQLPGIAADTQKMMANTNRFVVSLDNGYGDNTKFNRDLERLLMQTNDAVRSIRLLADLLARHPEALIKGRSAGGLE